MTRITKKKRSRELTPWQKLVQKFGIKGAKERYEKAAKVKIEEKPRENSIPPSSMVWQEEKVSVFIDRGNPLPEAYGETKVVLLPRDTHWIFAYWEVAEKAIEEVKTKLGEAIVAKSNLHLRFYDVTNIIFDGKNAHTYYDVRVDTVIGNWYFQAPNSGRCYLSEIGFLTPQGEFVPLARSNTVSLPRGKVSEISDEKWVTVKEEFEEFVKKMHLDVPAPGSEEAIKILSRRLEEILPLGAGSAMSSLRKAK